VSDTATAPAVTDGDPNDIATYLQVTAGKLRRLAEEITEAPTATTLDRFIALDTLKKGAETIVNATKKQIGDRDNGVMAELMAEFHDGGELEAAGTPVTDEELNRLVPEQLHGLLELKPSPVISVRS
jgi:hypothetical protein